MDVGNMPRVVLGAEPPLDKLPGDALYFVLYVTVIGIKTVPNSIS